MNAWNHMLKSHLDEFPRAYAMNAKQKHAYRKHERHYWGALRQAAGRWLRRAWDWWVAPSARDGQIQSGRRQFRSDLA